MYEGSKAYGSTIWRAVNSPNGARLLEITREHLKIAKELPSSPTAAQVQSGIDVLHHEREILKARVEQLRRERDAILSKYEDSGGQYGI